MPRVIKKPEAKRDLIERMAYLDQINPGLAGRFLAAVETTFSRLAEMPGLGGLCELDIPGCPDLRVFPVKRFAKYLVFYRALPDGIDVIRVLHGAQDIEGILRATYDPRFAE
jgi:toxin ParE1/3/4